MPSKLKVKIPSKSLFKEFARYSSTPTFTVPVALAEIIPGTRSLKLLQKAFPSSVKVMVP